MAAVEKPRQEKKDISVKSAEVSVFGGKLLLSCVAPTKREEARLNTKLAVKPPKHRLEFLYLKMMNLFKQATAQGASFIDIFEHFHTDDSGLIDPPQLLNGLQRVGIFVSAPESKGIVVSRSCS